MMMVKAEFKLNATVRELVNVPLFDGAEVYIVWAISGSPVSGQRMHGHLSTTVNEGVRVHNHRVSFEKHGDISGTFKVQVKGNRRDETVEAEDKWLGVQFMMKRKGKGNKRKSSCGHDEVLGVVNLNLLEFMNDWDRKEMRLLLEESKTNSIAKMSAWVKPVDGDESVKYHASAGSRGSTAVVGSSFDEGMFGHSTTTPTMTTTTMTTTTASSVPMPKALASMDANGNVADAEEAEVSADTQTMMIRACEAALQDTSIVNELLSNTYRFTWQLKTHRYKEFSPTECVRDIVERNGNGWKKNEEGLNMIDVVVADEVERSHGSKNGGYSDADEEWEIERDAAGVFEELSEQEQELGEEQELEEELDSEAVEDELFKIYYRSSKKNNVRRLKPLSEADVREDLRSWHVSV